MAEEANSDAFPLGDIGRSKYSTRLVLEVQRKLLKALDSPSQRGDLLRQLFTDVALEVDARALGLLCETDHIREPSEVLRAVGRGRKNSLCFYEVLAEHYAQVPATANEVLELFRQLWSQAFAAQIFSLLMYKWLFEVAAVNSDGFLRCSRAFIEGANNIFWIDLHGNVRRFFPLYNYVFEEVALVSSQLSKMPIQLQRDLFVLLSKFFFFYEPAGRLQIFLRSFWNHAKAADAFVIELTDQLQKVKVEPVVLHYLRSTKSLQGMELRAATSTRLKSALYSFTSPGSPMYPTRAVRHEAWETLDDLFPVGRYSRHLISLFFRMLYPYYWPLSFLNFVITATMAVVGCVLDVIQEIWQRTFGP